jgi:hypothetical protein
MNKEKKNWRPKKDDQNKAQRKKKDTTDFLPISFQRNGFFFSFKKINRNQTR